MLSVTPDFLRVALKKLAKAMRKKITLLILALAVLCAGLVSVSAATSTVEFELTEIRVTEDSSLNYTRYRIRRTGDLSEPASVVLSTVEGTATGYGDDRDFSPFSYRLHFTPGESEVELEAVARDGDIYEGTEWFSIRLSQPGPNTRVGSQHTMTVYINDSPDYPKITMGCEMKVEPGAGRQAALSCGIGPHRRSVEPITVSFTTSDMTATAGLDYVASSGTLELAPLEGGKVVTITILGDGLDEPRETFKIQPFNAINAEIYTQYALPTIINSTPYLQQIDFDGDGRADLANYDPTSANWFTGSRGRTQFQFGAPADVIVPGDYTGDGETDVAVWRPSTGDWYVVRSEDGSYYAVHFGAIGDTPVPADYDADGVADFAVFRPSSGTWYIQRSSNGSVDVVQFGAASDRPAPADFDGDWKADIAVYRPYAGESEWWIQRSSDGVVSVTRFGEASDKTVAADYTGDGKADVAVWRPSTGQWFVLRSEDGTYFVTWPYGGVSAPAPGDYSGDGRADYGHLNNDCHCWVIRYSANLQYGYLDYLMSPSATVPLASVNVH